MAVEAQAVTLSFDDVIDCPSSYVVDGDTLRCGDFRLRLLGIDAPELNHCPKWRVCVSGDGQAARQSLVAALKLGSIRYRAITLDRFGRTVAVVWAAGSTCPVGNCNAHRRSARRSGMMGE